MIAELIEKIANGMLNSTTDDKIKGFWVAVICVGLTNFFGWALFQGLMKSIIGSELVQATTKFFNRLDKTFHKHFTYKATGPMKTVEDFNNFNPLPGDICVSADLSLYGKTINFFESLWTGNAVYNHAFTWVDSTSCVESLVKITHSSKTKYTKRKTRTYRIPLTDEERKAIQVGLLARVNGAYGFDKYPLFMLDSICSWFKKNILRQKNPCFFFTKNFHISNIPVCSQLVVWACAKFSSYRLKDAQGNEVSWMVVNPDYLDDLLKLPINNATVVYEQEEIK